MRKWILALGICVNVLGFSNDTPPPFPVRPSDEFQFGRLWKQIKQAQKNQDLSELVSLRRGEIAAQKDHWKQKIPPLFPEIEELLNQGSLEPADCGCGGAYFLKCPNGHPLYVVKPVDEDVLCLNNRKQYGSPFSSRAYRVRDHIPLYRSAQAEALSYAFSEHLGLSYLTPPTYLGIVQHPAFFDILDHTQEEHEPLEKLCSIQCYLSDVTKLLPFIQDCLEGQLSEEEILKLVDRRDFENLCLLIWLLFDTDAHAGNLCVQKTEQESFRILKIDNGLTFPQKNAQLLNALYYFPHAKARLSKHLRKKIAHLPVEKLVQLIHFYELEDTVEAFLERVYVLQTLTKDAKYTFREIDLRLHALSADNGQQMALNPRLSPCDFKKLLTYE